MCSYSCGSAGSSGDVYLKAATPHDTSMVSWRRMGRRSHEHLQTSGEGRKVAWEEEERQLQITNWSLTPILKCLILFVCSLVHGPSRDGGSGHRTLESQNMFLGFLYELMVLLTVKKGHWKFSRNQIPRCREFKNVVGCPRCMTTFFPKSNQKTQEKVQRTSFNCFQKKIPKRKGPACQKRI